MRCVAVLKWLLLAAAVLWVRLLRGFVQTQVNPDPARVTSSWYQNQLDISTASVVS